MGEESKGGGEGRHVPRAKSEWLCSRAFNALTPVFNALTPVFNALTPVFNALTPRVPPPALTRPNMQPFLPPPNLPPTPPTSLSALFLLSSLSSLHPPSLPSPLGVFAIASRGGLTPRSLVSAFWVAFPSVLGLRTWALSTYKNDTAWYKSRRCQTPTWTREKREARMSGSCVSRAALTLRASSSFSSRPLIETSPCTNPPPRARLDVGACYSQPCIHTDAGVCRYAARARVLSVCVRVS
eukprot:3529650-Rhodomonas_salina.1